MTIGGSSELVDLPEVKRPRLENGLKDEITFTKQDAESMQAPHNHAVVVTINIIYYNVHHVFIDNRSSIDILYFSVFFQMGFTSDQLSRFDTPI